MSVFAQRINDLSLNFRLKPMDRAKLLVHYPLFKMAWHATYGSSWRKKASKKIMPAFSNYRTSFIARGKGDVRIPVPISFQLADLGIFEEIFFGREYESPVQLAECKTYVDLGGNIGMAALYFSLKCNLEQMILIEANPRLIPVLEKNLSGARNAGKKVQIVHGYVSGTSQGLIDFHASDDHGMSTAATLASNKNGKVVSLPQVPLRQLLDNLKLNQVDILKMDIEGGEYNLMKEDPTVFQRFKHIFAEIHGGADQREQFVRQIQDLGFEIVHGKKAETGFDTILARKI